MADKKISALTALAQGDVAVSTDVLPIVDTSATETKKIAVNALVGAAAAAGLTNVDINSGTIDGATIATSDITVGAGKTLNVSAGTLTLADNQISGDKVEGGTINAITINTLTSTAVNATTVDATNIEVTNLKAKDGTAAGSIADSTGIVTLASSVLTTTDINGGTIDGTAIGASSASTGAFSTISASGNLTLSGGTASGVVYLNGSKVATSGSALTFDGTTLGSTGLIVSTNRGQFKGNSTTGFAGGGVEIGYTGTIGIVNSYDRTASAYKDLQLYGADIYNYVKGSSAIWDIAGSNEVMRLTSTGLGIGTASPAYKLDVNGAANFADNTIHRCGGQPMFARGGASLSYLYAGTSAMVWRNNADSADLMRLDASGNLGLGVAPSAWGSTWKALQITSWASLGAETSSSGECTLLQNAYASGASTFNYIGSFAATRYTLENSVHKWYTAPSGTAGNAISFTQAMTLDASSNLIVGGTAAVNTSSGRGNVTVNGSSAGILNFSVGGAARSYLFQTGTDFIITNLAAAGGALIFENNGSERARITSGGKLLVGTTTAGYGLFTTQRVTINPDNDGIVVAPLSQNLSAYTVQANNDTGTRYAMYIANGSSTAVGTISFTSTATAYNTSSDYRLKNNIAPMTGALAKVALLKPCTYKWNADGSDGQGFIAHELAEVVPQCVTGEKDAVDAEGKPRYQGVDTSFLVATLTAAIQELTARVAALESK